MLYDISPLLHPGIAVWPGDVAFSRQESLRLLNGDPCDLSSVECSLHTGSHADAPSHYLEDGATIDQVDLSLYIGPATLVILSNASGPIKPAELREHVQEPPKRLLVCSHPGINPDVFPRSIRSFTPEAAGWLGQAGTRLIGTDAPSVDPLDSKNLPAHKTFGRSGTIILENLSLAGVPAGVYELIALPLKIANGDASPVRAVLRK